MMNFNRLLVLFFILAMVGCGDGDSSDSGSDPSNGGAPVGEPSITLETSLASGEQVPQGGSTTVTATYLRPDGNPVTDGTFVYFETTDGRIDFRVSTVAGKAIATYFASTAGGVVTITADTGSPGNFLSGYELEDGTKVYPTGAITLPVAVSAGTLNLSTSLPSGSDLAQSGTTTVTATVYGDDGTLVADGTDVVFSSTRGTITGAASTVAGKATVSYVADNVGGDVVITASAATNADVTDQLSLTIASGPAAWIELLSITPSRLGLRGTGLNEVGVVTFSVKDSGGNPVSDGTQVAFSLDAPTAGGEYLSPRVGYTVGGQIAVSLVSGTVGGVATVTASTNASAITVSTEARVTMGYGRPDQLHLSLFFDKLNDPGQIFFNITNTINAAVADRYSNPVPAGTPVYFASECGIVSLDNNLTDAMGVTSVNWITARPVAADGNCTTIIWTEGEEAYIDSNANGAYDLGEPHTGIGEPYIDANENGSYDATETYFDLDENGSYTPADSVWDADTFVWVEATTRYSDYTAAPVITPSSFNIASGSFQDFAITIADVDGGPLPAGSTAVVSETCNFGTLTGDINIVIPDAASTGPGKTQFSVRLSSTNSTTGDPEPCALTVDVSADINGPGSSTVNGQLD